MKDLGFQAILHADIIDPRNRKRIPYRHRYIFIYPEKSILPNRPNKTSWRD